jgi:hypothetical protein
MHIFYTEKGKGEIIKHTYSMKTSVQLDVKNMPM